MQSNSPEDQILRSYLLGELSEEEAERLEQRFSDDHLFDLCEAIEADLLAALDRGELAAAEEEEVLQRLAASAAGRERLALARSLNAAADRLAAAKPHVIPISSRRATVPPRSTTRWAALAAAVLLAVIGAWLAVRTLQPRGNAPRVANQISSPGSQTPSAPAERPVSPATEAPVTREQPPAADRIARQAEPVLPPRTEQPAPVKSTFALSLMTFRGADGVEVLRIPAGTDLVEIQLLDLEGLEEVESFAAAVRKEEGETVWEKGGFAPRRLEEGTVLVLEVPAQHLTSGRYEVEVTAGTEKLKKEFEVVRERQ